MEPSGVKKPMNMYLAPLLAGATAGFSVDVALYPLDTLKTRIQSEQGFYKTGGFRDIYRGLSAVVATSMPTSALFFVSYETTKTLLQPHVALQYAPFVHMFAASVGEVVSLSAVVATSMPTSALFFVSYETTKTVLQPHVALQYAPFVHMFAASVGEVFACLIRVPTEIAKQRKQTYTGNNMKSNIGILLDAYKQEGFRRGVYRGFASTVIRDLPFSFIELPIWEMLKTLVRQHNDGQITSLQSAVCGSIAGGFAAGVTTPLDLAKTRIMLAEGYNEERKLRIRPVLASIYLESGVRGLFAGAMPRITCFMIGGFVFFGVYDDIKNLIESKL